jgi:hypothetical protein
MAVQSFDVLLPITVIGEAKSCIIFDVLNNRGNPDLVNILVTLYLPSKGELTAVKPIS